jgi:hypothetical protein
MGPAGLEPDDDLANADMTSAGELDADVTDTEQQETA